MDAPGKSAHGERWVRLVSTRSRARPAAVMASDGFPPSEAEPQVFSHMNEFTVGIVIIVRRLYLLPGAPLPRPFQGAGIPVRKAMTNADRRALKTQFFGLRQTLARLSTTRRGNTLDCLDFVCRTEVIVWRINCRAAESTATLRFLCCARSIWLVVRQLHNSAFYRHSVSSAASRVN
jgi:hypothetical protein